MTTTTTATPIGLTEPPAPRTSSASSALLVALGSAAAFGLSGSFAKTLLDAGWSPAGAVTARIGLAALVLIGPTMHALRGRWQLLRTHGGTILFYGLTGVAGCQLAYFNAVQHLSIGVALLLEYTSPVLLVLWFWARSRRSPGRITIAGAGLCVAGLALVLDVLGGLHLSLVGVAWGLGAAVCSASYFVVASEPREDLPPLALAGAGMVVGAAALVLLGLLGVLPMHASTHGVEFAGHHTSVLVPLVGLGVVSTAVAYLTGGIAARRLGATVSSFVALAEVLFAVLAAWLLLGQLPLPVQLAGGVLIVGGIVLVRVAELNRVPIAPTPA